MNLKTKLFLTFSHMAIGVLGFGLGIYLLPILIAPPSPTTEALAETSQSAMFTAKFTRARQDSDRFHWGEGTVSLGASYIAFEGELAPGPDYKLYLAKEFVETEGRFIELKPEMLRVGDVKTFNNFLVSLPPGVDITQYNTVIVWCETFGEFITSAQYQGL